MKNKLSTILLILVFIIGLSLLLYPTFSDWWNSFHQTRAISNYSDSVASLDSAEYQAIWDSAAAYNAALAARGSHWILSDQELEAYQAQLNVGGTGIMGYIEIPGISVSLPIYHGTEANVLQIAVGHIAGSSLPVGGESTHCVLSGHRGLPSARLFTDLDQMVVGDLFMLHTLDETLTYEVDQILIVEPQEVDALEIVEGMDYCTLVTCTPYGINTHRLLVRGRRVENLKEAVLVTADAAQVRPVLVAPVIAAPVLLVLILIVFLRHRKRRRE